MSLIRAIPEGTLFYDDLYNSNRILGPLFYIFFHVLVFLVLMNMFLAIINSNYEQVRMMNKAQQSNATPFTELLKSFGANQKRKALGALQTTKLSSYRQTSALSRETSALGESSTSFTNKNDPNKRCAASAVLNEDSGKPNLQRGKTLGNGLAKITQAMLEADNDGDGDGTVDLAELVAGLRKELGASAPDAQSMAEHVLNEFDIDDDGNLSKSEVALARAVLTQAAEVYANDAAEHEAKAQRQSRVSISLGIGSPDSPLVGRMSNVFGGAGGEDLTQLWAKQAALTRTLEARVAQIDRLERAVRQMGGGGGGAGAAADDSGRGDWPPGAADDPLHA